VDKNAAYPPTIDSLKADETLTKATELRRVKYLNNIVEQDHRFIKRLINQDGMRAHSIQRGERAGYEAMNMRSYWSSLGSRKRRHYVLGRIRAQIFFWA